MYYYFPNGSVIWKKQTPDVFESVFTLRGSAYGIGSTLGVPGGIDIYVKHKVCYQSEDLNELLGIAALEAL